MYIKIAKQKLKRIIQKFSIWNKRLFNPNVYLSIKLDESQKKAFSICIKMINHPNSELLTSMLSEKRYMKNGDYFVIIGMHDIKIVNHVYSYDIPLMGSKITNLKRLFDNKIDASRLAMEAEILSNVKHSLEDIKNNINLI